MDSFEGVFTVNVFMVHFLGVTLKVFVMDSEKGFKVWRRAVEGAFFSDKFWSFFGPIVNIMLVDSVEAFSAEGSRNVWSLLLARAELTKAAYQRYSHSQLLLESWSMQEVDARPMLGARPRNAGRSNGARISITLIYILSGAGCPYGWDCTNSNPCWTSMLWAASGAG